jgi:hypothetical protein
MQTEDHIEDRDDFPCYRAPEEINVNELLGALKTLHLLNGDPYLGMQAFNVSIVDKFIMDLEYDVLRKLDNEETTPMPEMTFLSAQSQMWIFAVYELLRTWRERARDAVQLFEHGGLRNKIDALEQKRDYVHVGREIRAIQLREILQDSTIIEKIMDDLRITHIPFARIESVRITLAKHEIRGRDKSIAYAPGYGRINRWCGSLEYERESGVGVIIDAISRRDIAEELRKISDRTNPPTDEELASFDIFMKGPPSKS